MSISHELIIVGGGPAGLSAGTYAARSRIRAVLLEKGLPGGQIVNAVLVENYPGFPQGISGAGLGSLMEEQAKKFGLQTAMAEVERVEIRGEEKAVITSDGEHIARSLIIASGSEYRHLGVPGEEEFRGRGISYCATCDGAFFGDQVVSVVGGGNVAINDALFLTRLAAKVIVIHRRDELRATKILQERAFAEPKIEFLWDSVVESIEGDNQVRGLRVRNVKTKQETRLEASGVFVAVGLHPNTGFLRGVLDLDPEGFVAVSNQVETSVPGVFAAGDVRAGSPRQVASAVGDGATAAIAAEKYLSGVK